MNLKPDLPENCMVNNLRRATRLLSQKMDNALSIVGIKSTQFSLLVTIRCTGPIPITKLAEALQMERTTLTRNLKPVMEKQWVKMEQAEDQRMKLINITEQGLKTLEKAEPIWRTQQLHLVELLDSGEWKNNYLAIEKMAKVSNT